MSQYSSLVNSFMYSLLMRQGNSPAPKPVDIQAMMNLFEMVMLNVDYSIQEIEDVYKTAIKNPDINDDIKAVIKKNIVMNYQTEIRKK